MLMYVLSQSFHQVNILTGAFGFEFEGWCFFFFFCSSGMGNLIIMGSVRVKLIYRIFFSSKKKIQMQLYLYVLYAVERAFAFDFLLQLLPRLHN